MSASAWYGMDNNAGLMLGFSPDRDAEIQFILEQFSDSASAPVEPLVPTTDLRYMFGPKLRFLDQNNGNAISLTGRVLFGRRVESGTSYGVFFAELVAGYKPSSALSFTTAAKLSAFSSTEIAGLGFGVNYALSDKLELIGEVTPVGLDGGDTVWAAGLRYRIGDTGLMMDLQGTNAIGRVGVGSMIAQDDPRFALTFTKVFDLRGAKFY
ncbi:hypothetical protein [uncultured Shimia sp.]|uniref:hypothetical protein n=1 Tax=uncultured Shimia sp. TaxID=573152 RepID=UPI00261F4242|nr:hypothetical protein [uncultured Shimia sp.]